MHLPLAGAIVQAKLPVQGLVSFLHAATKGETVMHDDDADNDADDDDDDDDDDSKGSAPTAKKTVQRTIFFAVQCLHLEEGLAGPGEGKVRG